MFKCPTHRNAHPVFVDPSWALSELYLLISTFVKALTSELDKANRGRGVKSVCVSWFGELAGGAVRVKG